MILTIDIGNTTAHFGLFKKGKLLKEWRVSTGRISGDQGIRKGISGYKDISKVVVSSVVPSANKAIKKLFPQAVFVDHKNVGIRIKMKKPSEVGADRLVNALAAYILYRGPCIVVDFGTATTFDVISQKGEYLGGAIAPGVLLSRDCLHDRTAKLPLIEIKQPHRVIGKNTLEAMRSGLVYGYAGMVEGMIARIKSELTPYPPLLLREGEQKGVSLKVIATGGLAGLICKYTTVVDRIDDKLTLKGLRIIVDRLNGTSD